MQAIPGGIKVKAMIETPQSPYRVTACFSVISSLTPEQGIHDECEFGIFARRAMVDQAR